MDPALGCFKATLKLVIRPCIASIQGHDVQTPLLSYGQCQELAIILPDFSPRCYTCQQVCKLPRNIYYNNDISSSTVNTIS